MHTRFNSKYTQIITISWEVLCKEERSRTCTSLDPKEDICTQPPIRHGLKKNKTIRNTQALTSTYQTTRENTLLWISIETQT